MILTVGNLKKILNQVDDSAVLADLGHSNNDFKVFSYLKRMLLLKDTKGNLYLAINSMGSHFSEAHIENYGLKILASFDETNDFVIKNV